MNFGIGGGGVGVEVRDGYDRDWRDDRWRERNEWRERRDWRAQRCSPDRALWKAERMGVRRARIKDVNRHSITVRGRSRGERIWVTFGRSPGCPIIG